MLSATKPHHQPIYRTIFEGNNFPRQYHALNSIFRLLHSYTKISNLFFKINFRYLSKSKAAVLRCSTKRVFRSF